MKTYFISGGTGSFGKEFVKTLLQNHRPKKLIIYSRDELKQFEMEKILHEDCMRYFIGDVRDRDALKKAIDGIDIIVHDAAEVGVGQSMYSINQYISTNVGGTGILWDILVNEKHKVEKVVIASSMSNYGEGRFFCPNHEKISPKKEDPIIGASCPFSRPMDTCQQE